MKYWSQNEIAFLQENLNILSYSEIATKLGRTRNAVKYKSIRFKDKKANLFSKKILETELQSGLSVADIANKYNRTPACVYQNLKKFNLKLPLKTLQESYLNKNFGYLIPKEIIVGSSPTMFLCDCKCGKKCKVRIDALNTDNTASCGCKRLERYQEYKSTTNGGNIPKNYWRKLIRRAKEYNREFSIKSFETWNLFLIQDKKCMLSGDDIILDENNMTASLDRIDSSKGYIEGNVQWIHKDLQDMKLDKKQEEFIAWCTKIAKYQNKI